MNKKELKEQYKAIKPGIGVFQIRNTVNGKVFVEGSTNLDKIWNRHRAQLNFGGHPNPTLQQEWKTFGENSFVFEILSELTLPDEATDSDAKNEMKLLEAMFIEELQPFGDKGYNRKPTKG
jgi:hypothetical protein